MHLHHGRPVARPARGGAGRASRRGRDHRAHLAARAGRRPGEPISTEAVLVAPRCPAAAGCGAAPCQAPALHVRRRRRSRRAAAGWPSSSSTPRSRRRHPCSSSSTPPPGSCLASFTHSSHAVVVTGRVDARVLARRRGVVLRSGDGDADQRFRRAIRSWRPRSGARSASNSSSTSPGRRDLEHLELADSVVLARYPIPGLTGRSSDPAISPDGTQLAFLRSTPRRAGDLAGRPRRDVDAAHGCSTRSLQPIGFTARGTLVGIASPLRAAPTLVLVSVAGDEQIPIASGPAPGSLDTVVVAPVRPSARLPLPRRRRRSSRRTSRTPTAATRCRSPASRPRTLRGRDGHGERMRRLLFLIADTGGGHRAAADCRRATDHRHRRPASSRSRSSIRSRPQNRGSSEGPPACTGRSPVTRGGCGAASITPPTAGRRWRCSSARCCAR